MARGELLDSAASDGCYFGQDNFKIQEDAKVVCVAAHAYLLALPASSVDEALAALQPPTSDAGCVSALENRVSPQAHAADVQQLRRSAPGARPELQYECGRVFVRMAVMRASDPGATADVAELPGAPNDIVVLDQRLSIEAARQDPQDELFLLVAQARMEYHRVPRG